MDLLIKNELNMTNESTSSPRVLWEEEGGQLSTSTSILDILIPVSDLTIDVLCDLTYVKKKDNILLHGQPLLRLTSGGPEWRLTGAFDRMPKRKVAKKEAKMVKKEASWKSQSDTDFDSMVETDGSSWSEQAFSGRKRSNPQPSSEEKNWERLLKNIYYHMLKSYKMEQVSKPRYWSSEFATVAVKDDIDSRKPDLVLMDYKLKNSQPPVVKTWAHILTGIEITRSELSVGGRDIPVYLGTATKGYLIMKEQPWRRFVLLFSIANLKLRAHYIDRSGIIISAPIKIGPNATRFVDVVNTMTLSDHKSLGFDPTIHICSDLCSKSATHDHDGLLPLGVHHMLDQAIGCVTDNDSKVYWIMAILWKSHGLFSRGTVCYRVQDEAGEVFALKDCWVDEKTLEHEVELLKAVEGVPNVVQLKKCWDVMYNGKRDSTSTIREHIDSTYPAKVHRRMLLTPCGLPLTSATSVAQLVSVFQDLVIAHETMVFKRNVLHGDLSPYNIVIHEGKGYFIDFDHAKFLESLTAVVSRGTGTVPYMSSRLLKLLSDRVPGSTPKITYRPADDLESLFYIFLEFTTVYDGPGGEISDKGVHPANARRWRKAFVTMDQDGLGTSGILKEHFIVSGDDNYKPTPYFQACYPILEEWRKAIASTIANDEGISHKQLRKIIQQGLDKLSPVPAAPLANRMLPPAAPSTVQDAPPPSAFTMAKR